jgi:hypothetical protein
MVVRVDQSWLDPSAPWNVKAHRAARHIEELRREVVAIRDRESFAPTPEPTETPGRLAYRLKFQMPIPVELSAIVGDVVHNLRSALECVANELAAHARALRRTATTAMWGDGRRPAQVAGGQLGQQISHALSPVPRLVSSARLRAWPRR